jgi:3-hydroxyisobutyrate dehydrogenase
VSPSEQSVSVLGTGTMGRPMAENLARAGYRVRVWDPQRDRSQAVSGATAYEDVAAAVDGAHVVVTMAPDGPAVAETMLGSGDVLSAMSPGTLWLQTSTVGPDWAQEFAVRGEERSLVVVDSPVIGTLDEAVSGELYFFASASEKVRPRCRPLLEIMGTRTFWYERPGDGQRMKLAVNGWILTMIELVAESLVLTERLGREPRQFIEVLEHHPTGSPLLRHAGGAMIDGDFTGGLRLTLAHKDLELILDAADKVGVDLAVARVTRDRMARAMTLGHAEANAIATYLVARADH